MVSGAFHIIAGRKQEQQISTLAGSLLFLLIFQGFSQYGVWCCIHSVWVLPILVNVIYKCHRCALLLEALLNPTSLSMKINHCSCNIPPQPPKGSGASHNANSSSPSPRLSIILIIPTLSKCASSKSPLILRASSYFKKERWGYRNERLDQSNIKT